MNECLVLFFAGMGGVLLGAIFFGGLWWTVQRKLSSDLAALWFLGSLMLRTSLVLAGFYLIGHGDWRKLLVCLLGFLFARISLTLLLGKKGRHPCA